jgi:hypothetical protein
VRTETEKGEEPICEEKNKWNECVRLGIAIIIIIIIIFSRVFTLIFLKQTMSPGNTVLQLFCSYSSQCV